MLSGSQIQLNPITYEKTPAFKLKPNTPKQIKEILLQLSRPVPKYLNQKILTSEDRLEIISQIDTWYNLEAFYSNPSMNYQPQLLKSIQPIHFPRLSKLYLQNIQLCSFEPIEWIDAPSLKAMYLMKNRSRNIKPLAKTRFNFLLIIQLDSDLPHSQLYNITRTKLSTRAKITTHNPQYPTNKNLKDRLSSPVQQTNFPITVIKLETGQNILEYIDVNEQMKLYQESVAKSTIDNM